jgi:hypothetical protein
MGIKVENLSTDILNQYTILDKALQRVKQMLSINDAFLGQSFASDSGEKVKIQRNSSIMALKYITDRIEEFLTTLGLNLIDLMKTYYKAEDILRISDDYEGQRYIKINQPIQMTNGRYVYEHLGDGKVRPISVRSTDISEIEVDLKVVSKPANIDDIEDQQALIEFINGPTGQIMSQVNLPGYLYLSSLVANSFKSKYSGDISKIIKQTAQMITEQQKAQIAQGANNNV